jgi:hypothetical protein
MKPVERIENTIETFLQEHIMQDAVKYWDDIDNPNENINGYPPTLIYCLADPTYYQNKREVCSLITRERLIHPILMIQKAVQNLDTLIKDTIHTLHNFREEKRKLRQITGLETYINNIQVSLDETIQNFTLLLKQFINKQKTLKKGV